MHWVVGNKKANVKPAPFLPPFPCPASLLHCQLLYLPRATEAGWGSVAATAS